MLSQSPEKESSESNPLQLARPDGGELAVRPAIPKETHKTQGCAGRTA